MEGKGNKKEGELENEKRKRENKHAPNKLATEREERKKKKTIRELGPRKNTRK